MSVPHFLRTTACSAAAALGILLCPSCEQPKRQDTSAEAEQADAAKEEEEYERRELERDIELWETKRHRAAKQREAAQERLRKKDEDIATLTKQIALKEEEVAQLPDTPVEDDPAPGAPARVPGEFITKVTAQVVVIEGDQGVGTGFLCETEDQVWVYTAAHVLSGNRRITVRDSRGRRYKEFDYMECAEGVDLVRLKPTTGDFKGLKLESAETAPKVGDVIVAIGNSGGTGSLSAEPGRVRSIEDDMWEVDAEIIPGNSGGPVLSLESGNVAGIVTHLIINRRKGERALYGEAETKRFAARLDKEWKWRRMPVPRFVKEWDHIEKMEKETAIAWASAYLMYSGSGGNRRDPELDRTLRPIAEEIISEAKNHFHAQRMRTWLKRFHEAGTLQKRGLINEGNTLVERIVDDIRVKQSDPKAEDFSWYHRQSYEAAREWRDELTAD